MSDAELNDWTKSTEMWQVTDKCSSLDQNMQLRVLKDLKLCNKCDLPLVCVMADCQVFLVKQ